MTEEPQLKIGDHKYWIVTFDNKTNAGYQHRVPGETEEEAVSIARQSSKALAETAMESLNLDPVETAAIADFFENMPLRSCIKATAKNFWPEVLEKLELCDRCKVNSKEKGGTCPYDQEMRGIKTECECCLLCSRQCVAAT